MEKNKYQKELENLNEARLSINTVCEWLPKPVLDDLEEYGGEYDVYHYVDRSIFQELVDRATDMKVDMEDIRYSEEYEYPVHKCPKCSKSVTDNYEYCPYCGQKLGWSWTND